MKKLAHSVCIPSPVCVFSDLTVSYSSLRFQNAQISFRQVVISPLPPPACVYVCS